jgi:subfamily B ATP-binding cassette protein HlyB/CyaB
VELGHDQVLWLLGSLCGLNRVPFDPKLVAQNYPPPYSETTLFEAAGALGFRLGAARFDRKFAGRLRASCIAFLKPEANLQAASGPPAPRLALILRGDDQRLLYFEAGSSRPQSVALARAEEIFEPACYLAAFEGRAESLSPGEPGPAPGAGRFGFGWFARELLRHKSVWRNVLAASLALQLIGLATPLFTQVIIDKVVVHQTQSTLMVIAVALVMFMLFSAGLAWLRQYLILHTGNRVDAVLGSLVLRHLLRLSMPYFHHRPTGTLVARLHAVETIREFIAGAAVSLLLDLPFLAIFLAAMFWYSWQLSLLAVAILAFIAAASVVVTPLLRARLNRQFLLGARNQAFLTEYVAGIETVKALQMEPRLEARYDEYLAGYLAAGFDTRQLSNTFNTVVNALEQTMTLLILCAGALLVMRNDGFTIGMLVAFQMFAGRMSQPMLRLAGLWQEFQQANIAMKRLGDIMDAPAEPHALRPSRAAAGKGRVEIHRLAFRYGDDAPWLYRNLNLNLQPGRLTVVSGPSGSGKSTLARLLLGFYPPVEGEIRLDGRDIRHYPANELRQYYGVVPQDTFLFSGSLYENLLAASPHAGFSDIVAACKAAEIHDFIEQLPQGYNTVIGEHGAGLSGGQKQRIAIARAVLRRPKLLIFDEATSSLDQATAEQFAHTVNRLRGDAGILFIAHQWPAVLQSDETLRLGEAP